AFVPEASFGLRLRSPLGAPCLHPSGQCAKPAKCANCHGPYEAGHELCPAAPKRANGEIKRPTCNKLKKIRRNGRRAYANANAVASPRASAAPTNEEFTVVALSRQARKRYREGSAPTHVPPPMEVEMTDAPPQGPTNRLSRSRFQALVEEEMDIFPGG
ncbi:hypothetical protein E4U30_003550, partial [Claviceps sp. LM220 group G6]